MSKRLFSFISILLLTILLASCGKVFVVEFNVNGGNEVIENFEGKKGDKVTQPADPTKEGYIFLYWKEYTAIQPWDFEIDTLTKNITLYAFWEEDLEATITFEGESISLEPVKVIKGEKLQIATPTRQDYKFIGWKIKGTEEMFDLNEAVTVSLTLVAVWEEDLSVIVKFEGDDVNIASQLLEKGEKVSKPTDPVSEDKIFAGWYSDEDYNNEYDFNSLLTGNLTLYAKWAEGVNITYNFGYAAKENEKVLAIKGEKVTKPANPTRGTYVFGGWLVNGELFDFDEVVNDDLTLTAKWEEPALSKAIAFIEDDAYFSIDAIMNAVKENDVVLLKSGNYYREDFTISVNNLTFKPYENERVVIRSKITLAPNLVGVRFESLEFTSKAQIHAPGEIDKFVFVDNKVSNISLTKSDYKPNNRIDVNAFISLYTLVGENVIGDITIENNEFINISSDIISLARSSANKTIKIKNNTFHNFTTSAIRFDGGYNNGTYLIEGNTFSHDEQGGSLSAITFRCFAPSAGNKQIIKIINNEFVNVGNDKEEYDDIGGYPGSGVITFSTFNDQDTEVYINENTFTNTTRTIHFRNSGSASVLSANFTNNTFINNFEFYLYQSQAEPIANFNNNLFKDENGNIITNLTVIGQKIINNNNYSNIKTTED